MFINQKEYDHLKSLHINTTGEPELLIDTTNRNVKLRGLVIDGVANYFIISGDKIEMTNVHENEENFNKFVKLVEEFRGESQPVVVEENDNDKIVDITKEVVEEKPVVVKKVNKNKKEK